MLVTLAFAFALFVAGFGAGMLYWRRKIISAEHASRRIPKEWPLKPRLLMNSKERRVWLWLAKVMFDQQIMIKIPVTRFTTPARAEEAEQWFKLLNGLYCTFTVCDLQGRVVGCVDVPGKRGLSMSNQTLKHSLLSQCNLPYWVVEPDNLPHLAQIRAAFLGEDPVHGPGGAHLREKLKDVAGTLQAAVSKQRHQKSHQPSADTQISNGDAPISSNWENNSFLAPLDSRAAELHR